MPRTLTVTASRLALNLGLSFGLIVLPASLVLSVGQALAAEPVKAGQEKTVPASVRTAPEAEARARADLDKSHGPDVATVRLNDEAVSRDLDLKDGLSTLPGVTVESVVSNPGLNINIRGQSGSGRVNVTIDGVRQTFRIAGHEGGDFVYADPQLIGGVSVTKGKAEGGSGAGALTGAVNLRTVGVDDLLQPGRDSGARISFGGTNNGNSRQASAAGAARLNDIFAVAGAFSRIDRGNYEDGSGKTVNASGYEMDSGLLKLQIRPDSTQRVDIGARRTRTLFSSNFYDQTMTTQSITGDWRWKPETNSLRQLVDVSARIALGENSTLYGNKNYGGGGVGMTTNRRVTDKTFGLELSNQSLIAVGAQPLALRYGLYRFSNKVETRNGGVNPKGKLTLDGAWIKGETSFDRLTLGAGVTWDRYGLSGTGTAPNTKAPVPVIGDVITLSGHEDRFSPSAFASWAFSGNTDLTLRYEDTFRAPTTAEVLYGGAHPGDTRVIYYPNPNLKAETAKTISLGLRTRHGGLLRPDDTLKLRIDAYSSRIDNTINQIYVPEPGATFGKYFYTNLPGTSKSRGLELLADYDARIVFGQLNLDLQKQDLARGSYATFLPERRDMLLVGVRPFGEAFSVSVRTRGSGKTRLIVDNASIRNPSYRLVDLMADWRVSPSVRLSASVLNLQDKVHTPLYSVDDKGMGRTINVRLTGTF
ncbi:MAG: TonB-dependent receptor domain-containing protein [Asticcacaulis sp.]